MVQRHSVEKVAFEARVDHYMPWMTVYVLIFLRIVICYRRLPGPPSKALTPVVKRNAHTYTAWRPLVSMSGCTHEPCCVFSRFNSNAYSRRTVFAKMPNLYDSTSKDNWRTQQPLCSTVTFARITPSLPFRGCERRLSSNFSRSKALNPSIN